MQEDPSERDEMQGKKERLRQKTEKATAPENDQESN